MCIRLARLAAAASIVTMMPVAAVAQTYPSQSIKIVVPTSPGGPNDIVARFAADFIGKLGQPVVVENRSGAGGALGAREVAKAAPDGHTLLVANTSTMAINPAISANAGYDPVQSFAPVAKFWEAYQFLAVHASSPWKTVGDLVAEARGNPGKLNYAHGGTGNFQHMIGELMMLRTGVRFVGVPFRGSSDSINALLGQVVHFTYADGAVVMPLVQAGSMRVLGLTGAKRTALAPEVPTMAEVGIADFEATSFFGIVAPAGTPDPIVRMLNAAINEGLKSAKAQALITQMGVVSIQGSPEEFGAFIAAKSMQWRAVAVAAGIRTN